MQVATHVHVLIALYPRGNHDEEYVVDVTDWLSPCNAGDLGGESSHGSKIHLQSSLQVPASHGSCWQGKVKGHHKQDSCKQTLIRTGGDHYHMYIYMYC